MALTPQEEAELAALEAELGQRRPAAPAIVNQPAPSGLTPEEEAELAALESDPELQQIVQQPQEESFLSKILSPIETAGEYVDRYTGAPTRAALMEVAKGNIANIPGAFAAQFGEPTAQAPTGKQIAEEIGLSTEPIYRAGFDIPVETPSGRIVTAPTGQPLTTRPELPSPAGIAGLAVDIGADISNFVPVGALVKGAGKLAKGTARVAGKGARFAIKGSAAALDAEQGLENVIKARNTAQKYIESSAKNLKERWHPEVAKDFNEFASIAEKHGIDPSVLPETVEFGPQSTLAKKAKTIAEGPGGEPIQARYVKAQNEVENALENSINKISGGQKITSDADMGKILTDGYNNGIKSFFDQDFLTHNKIISKNPGMILDKPDLDAVKNQVSALKSRAIGRTRRGIGAQKQEASQLLNDLSVIENSFDKAGNLSYKRASELLSNIGEEAFKKIPPGMDRTPIDRKALQDLYFTLRDRMINTVSKSMSPEDATILANNNTLISDFLKEKGRVSKIFEGDLSPDKLAKRIKSSGDLNQIEALREILPASEFEKLKGYLLDGSIIRNAEGTPLYKSSIKKINKNKDIISLIAPGEEANEIIDLLRLGDRVGDFVLNSSNTNTARRFSPAEFFQNVLGGAADEVTLETLKDAARKKAATAIEVPKSVAAPLGVTQVTPKRASDLIKEINLIKSRKAKVLEAGKLMSIQEKNKLEENKLKRRKALGEN